MTKRLVLVLTILCVLSVGITAAQGATHAIAIDNMAFAPASITVAVGDKVTWTNSDDRPHTVTSAGKFDSGFMDVGKTFSFTFATAGTYAYVCEFHDEMQGTVVVQASSAPTPVESSPVTAPSTVPSTDPTSPPTTTDPSPIDVPDGGVSVPEDPAGSPTVSVITTRHGGKVIAVNVTADRVVFKVVKRNRQKRMQMVVDGDPAANLRLR